MKNTNEFYMRLASVIAGQSYCIRSQVGALIVKDNNILSFGYNGTPSGMSNSCEEITDTIIPQSVMQELRDAGLSYKQITEKYKLKMVTFPHVLHAESNAIVKCAKNGQSTNDASLYTSMCPCIECSKLIIQSGIDHVYYMDQYRDNSGLILLSSAGIKTICINLGDEKEKS